MLPGQDFEYIRGRQIIDDPICPRLPQRFLVKSSGANREALRIDRMGTPHVFRCVTDHNHVVRRVITKHPSELTRRSPGKIVTLDIQIATCDPRKKSVQLEVLELDSACLGKVAGHHGRSHVGFSREPTD